MTGTAVLKLNKPSGKRFLLGAISGLIIIGVAFLLLNNSSEIPTPAASESAQDELQIKAIERVRQEISATLGTYFRRDQWPTQAELHWQNRLQPVQLQYTFDKDLQQEAERLLSSYKPDYAAVVIMDANTGAVRAMASYEKGQPAPENLALKGSYPAASVFKIITATAALDKYSLSPDTMIMYNGGNHTLYKSNVLNSKITQWTRGITLREAFARSINTVFGRLAFEHLLPKDLEDYATRFGFNKTSTSDLPYESGMTQIPQEAGFELAEIASGYNRITRMSPVQGAMIAASVADAGIMRVPYVIESLSDNDGHALWKAQPVTAAITMSPMGASRLKELMGATIRQGTSRKWFREITRDHHYRDLELGGKTGSLMGDNPKGKVDWFVGYAIGGENDRLAIAAITVNKTYWTIKSSYLAQSLFKKHYKEQFTNQNQKFFKSVSN